MRVRKLLTQKRFEEWLDQHEDDEVVGFANTSSCCPISTYLKNTVLKDQGFFVLHPFTLQKVKIKRSKRFNEWNRRILKTHNYSRTVIPLWVRRFILKIDNRLDKKITASQARKLLKESCQNQKLY